MTLPIDDREFLVAFAVALVVGSAMLLVRLPARLLLVAAIGAVAGLTREYVWSWPLFFGVVLTAVGVGLAAWLPGRTSAIGAVPGAFVIALALPGLVPTWIALVSLAAVVFGSAFIGAVDRQAPQIAAVLVFVSAAGIYAAVPDTEHARALVGGTAAAVVIALSPRSRRSLVGAAAMAALFAWAEAIGGYARPPAFVAALGCIGLLGLLPMTGRRVKRLLEDLTGVVAIVLLHTGVVALSARVASRRGSVAAAVTVEIVIYVVAWMLLVTLPRLGTFRR